MLKNLKYLSVPRCKLYLCRVVLAGKYVYVEWNRIEFGFLGRAISIRYMYVLIRNM